MKTDCNVGSETLVSETWALSVVKSLAGLAFWTGHLHRMPLSVPPGVNTSQVPQDPSPRYSHCHLSPLFGEVLREWALSSSWRHSEDFQNSNFYLRVQFLLVVTNAANCSWSCNIILIIFKKMLPNTQLWIAMFARELQWKWYHEKSS